jgi:hypothetical protein
MAETTMTITRRIIAGNPYRKTRLHDEKGHLLRASDLLDLPTAAYHATLAAFGSRPPLPWFTYPAVRKIKSVLRSNFAVIEFGSGLSTRWFADRVASVHSIESDIRWYNTVKGTLPSNVFYELRSDSSYADLSTYQDGHFDFAVIDGDRRGDCMKSVLPKVKHGGFLYFDNSDKDMTLGDQAQGRVAERLLLERAQRLEHIRGLTVCMLSPHEGILAAL